VSHFENPEYPPTPEDPEPCGLCQGNRVLEGVPIPEKFHRLIDELCPGQFVGDPIYSVITCACCVFNQWDQPSPRSKYARAYSDVVCCLLGTATDQEWFNVCVTASDLPDPDVVGKWAEVFDVSMDKIAW